MALQDQGIDPNDTYVIMDAVQEGSTLLTSTEPFIDPRTNQTTYQLNIAPPAEHLHIEGGYDVYNRLRINTQQVDPLLDPLLSPVNLSRNIRSVENDFDLYDANGQLMPEVVPTGEMPVGPLSDDLGTLVDAQITQGVVLDSRSVDTLAALSVTPNSPLFSLAGAGG